MATDVSSAWANLLQRVAAKEKCPKLPEGTKISQAMAEELLSAARQAGNPPVLHGANFSGITFDGEVSFPNVKFVGYADFSKARFAERAYFSGSEFTSFASFRRAAFGGEAIFEDLQPSPDSSLSFEGARFAKYCSFGPLHQRQVSFNGCQFAEFAMFWDLRVDRSFNIINARFTEPLWHFNAGCKHLCLRRTRFERGATLRLHGGDVDLEGAEFLSTSFILGSTKSGQFLAESASLVVDGGGWQPRLVSIAGVDASNLVLADVDASQCVFRGALKLDGLRFATSCPMDHPPKGLCFGRSFPFVWWWSDRMTIREERDWRAEGARSYGWVGNPAASAPAERDAQDDTEEKLSHRAEAERLAKVYRALRKGREDEKNEPGAVDFYYGEMEMRRHGLASISERFLLWLYWLLSGYSLRPSRTLATLVVLWLAFAVAFHKSGFAMPGFTFLQALQVSMASTVNLDVVKNEAFSFTGQWLRFPLRILGPLLYGLFLLAIRGRVKR